MGRGIIVEEEINRLKAEVNQLDHWRKEALAAREVFNHRNPSATESNECYRAWDNYVAIRWGNRGVEPKEEL